MNTRMRYSLLAVLGALIAAALTGCPYGRMYDQDAVKTYKKKMEAMDKRSIPVADGYAALVHADPDRLSNPLTLSPASIEQGRLAYSYFCAQCHGPNLDGKGTVGQSFSPLPANLVSHRDLARSDGVLYSRIRLGIDRHPPLFATISEMDTWAVILYIRQVGRGSS